jgi:chromosome condensin MukBEF ATPase and DNA-binding subunit MukB
MESTKEMLLPRPEIDGIQQSQIEMVTVDQGPGNRLISNDAQVDQQCNALLSKDIVLHSSHVYASDPNLTMMPDNSSRARLRRILSSHRFQVKQELNHHNLKTKIIPCCRCLSFPL